jgi:DNA-binding MurR/RpiR family transcriptional regulator
MRCDTRSSATIDNHTSVFLFCHLLVERVITKAGASGRKRFTRIDDLHVKFEEL